MRQVIRRFLKHLVAEKNASSSTIDTYRYGEFYPQLFGGKPLPPNKLLVVKQLVSAQIRLEIEAIAAV
jgi:enamine deaminase RidA (YjgF/YER057c/UK114 family)